MSNQPQTFIPASAAELDDLARNRKAQEVEPPNCRRCGAHISEHDKTNGWSNRARDCPRFE